jgi:hypothetical protein
MRVLIVIALIVAAILVVAFVLVDLAKDLSRHSYHAPPDMGNCDSAADEFADAAESDISRTARWTVGRCSITAIPGDTVRGSSSVLDDWHSAL